MAVRGTRSRLLATAAVLLATTIAHPARAWLFEEHAIIARSANVYVRDADRSAALDHAWKIFRGKFGTRRLCERRGQDPSDTREDCVDIGTLVALSGDHSCSIDELEGTLRVPSDPSEDWLVPLMKSVSKTNADIRSATDVSNILDAWRRANLDLNRIDVDYLTRASDNSAHFLTTQVNDTPFANREARFDRYLTRSISAGRKANAVSTYLTYQIGAVSAAAKARAAAENGREQERDVWTMRAILAETFALHFLGDAFSAGHIAGTHGSEAERLGTHDYYCQHGLSATLWDGRGYTAHGDAFMGKDDLAASAEAARASLNLLADALRGDYAPEWISNQTAAEAEVDICHDHVTPEIAAVLLAVEKDPRLRSVLEMTPEPAMNDAEVPRFTNEIGIFLQLQGGARGTLNVLPSGEFGTPYDARIGGALELGAGVGFSMSAVTNQSADGDIFAQASFVGDAKEQNIGNGNVAVAPRTGAGGRLRLPFYLVPGDMLLLSIAMLPIDRHAYESTMLRAAQGSVWWSFERVHFVSPIAWQIVLGREAAFYYFAATHEYPIQMSEPIGISPQSRTYQLEVPLVEGRTLGSFSGDLRGGGRAQIGVALESTQCWSQCLPSSPRVLDSMLAFLRVSFEGRYYVYRP